MQQTITLATPIGNINVTTQNNTIIKIDTLSDESPSKTSHLEIVEQLQQYFQNPAHRFTLATNPNGTDFQQRVWQALTTIPSGTTLTYGELAKRLNSSPRAIGQACRRNPIPIIIPCHRVIGATQLGGYAGETQGKLADMKKWLLQHEATQRVVETD